MLNDEQGQRKAIKLLPACIKRRPAERELVRDVLRSVESIEGALKVLEDMLDPPIDQYQMMQELCRSNWEPGTQVGVRETLKCWDEVCRLNTRFLTSEGHSKQATSRCNINSMENQQH